MSSNSPAFFEKASPRVFAHRGLAVSAQIAENTIEACAAAVAAGATHLETDVRVSADGIPVLHHDPHFLRAGRRIRVDSLTLDQLRDPALGPGPVIATLDELLEAFPTTPINVDLKSAAAVDPAVEAILRAHAEPRILLTSFSERTRRRALSRLSAVASSPGRWAGMVLILTHWLHLGRAFTRLAARVDAVQFPERYGPFPAMTPALIARLRGVGVESHVWTINDSADLRRLILVGVDGVITDRCDLAVSVIEDLRAEGF
ncbi:glycerophosphodiester phosphodiesterase family protein [Mycetocola saprophilus]|uniref:glycerophosphodiester phosphodiesterase family protein n=1 Tax=Mycetocola saprophilus TaxID=76636 RepID=UPI0004C27E21|nr:glycerophosphodiester phosphodiesterase family protein [Mycetocola saprophilus]